MVWNGTNQLVLAEHRLRNRFNFRVCRQSGEHKKWRNFRKRW